MENKESSEKVKADMSEDENIDNDDLLKKREDQDEQGNKSVRVVMPSIPGPFISKDEFIGLQKVDLSENLLNKYYERYRTKYREEEIQYYINQHQDDIWFSDLYNPFSGQKLEAIKIKNSLKKHQIFFDTLDESWLSTFDIGLNTTTLDINGMKQTAGYKLAESVASASFNSIPKSLFGELEFIFDGLPKDVSILDIWTQLVDKEWFWDLSTSLPVKHNNYTRTVYLTANPLTKTADMKEVSSLDISNYNFTLHNFQTTIFDLYCKTYQNNDEVKKDYNEVYSLLVKLFEKHELNLESFFEKLNGSHVSKRLAVITYYLWAVWGIDIVSKSRVEKNPKRKRVLLTNAADFTIEEGYSPEISNESIYKSLIDDSSLESSEDKIRNLVKKKVEEKIKDMLEEYEEGVWPCPKCGKFFENGDYVVKHFNQKHQEKVEKYRDHYKLEIKNSDFNLEKYKDVLIGNYENKINFNPFKDAIVHREMEKLKDKQALKLNYRWKYIEEY